MELKVSWKLIRVRMKSKWACDIHRIMYANITNTLLIVRCGSVEQTLFYPLSMFHDINNEISATQPIIIIEKCLICNMRHIRGFRLNLYISYEWWLRYSFQSSTVCHVSCAKRNNTKTWEKHHSRGNFYDLEFKLLYSYEYRWLNGMPCSIVFVYSFRLILFVSESYWVLISNQNISSISGKWSPVSKNTKDWVYSHAPHKVPP